MKKKFRADLQDAERLGASPKFLLFAIRPCAVQVRPISGAQGLVRKRALRLASRGFGNRQIAVTPCRRAVRAFSPVPFASFRKSAALHGGPSVVGAVVSIRHRLIALVAAVRVAGVCGADAARCCRLAPPRIRIRLAARPSAALST